MPIICLDSDEPWSFTAVTEFSSRAASRASPTRRPSKALISPIHASSKALASPTRQRSKTPRSPASKARPLRVRAPIKENAYKEGTYHLSSFDVLKRTFADSALEKNSNLGCSMLTTIVPNTAAVAESEQPKKIAMGASAVGLIAQVVLPERILRDENKVSEAVNSARQSFSHDGTGRAFAAKAAALAYSTEHQDQDPGSDIDKDEDAKDEDAGSSKTRRINRLGGFKVKRPEAINVPAIKSELFMDQSPGSATFSNSHLSGRRDRPSLLPSSVSPKWLQNLLHERSSKSRSKRVSKRPWATPRS